jgi:hypothetical protein
MKTTKQKTCYGKIQPGMKFGRLTVLSATEKRKHGSVVYKCRCDCGKETNVDGSKLKNRRTNSCGCLKIESTLKRHEQKRIKYGSRFGRLIVIENFGLKNDRMFYKCQCDCGKETNVDGSKLKNGSTKSCGCLARETIVYYNQNRRKRPLEMTRSIYRARMDALNLKDRYIKTLLIAGSVLKFFDIPKYLIALKRANLTLKRGLKENYYGNTQEA